MVGNLIPPVAWLRERVWGRDIVSSARGERSRIKGLESIERVFGDSDDFVQTLLDFHSFSALAEGGLYKGQRFRPTIEETRRTYAARNYERDVADMIHDHVADGSRIYKLSKQLIDRAMQEPSPLSGDMSMPFKSAYISCSHLESRTNDGRPLDGFMLTYLPPDEDGGGILYVLPMSRELPAVGEPMTPFPLFHLELDDPDRTLTEILLEEARRIRNFADGYAQVVQVDTKGDEYAYMQEVVNEISKEHAVLIGATADVIEEEAEAWSKTIGAALTAIADNPPRRTVYPNEAPADLVEKVAKGGTGARKADQKLAALGMPAMQLLDVPSETSDHVVDATPESVRVPDPIPVVPATQSQPKPRPGARSDEPGRVTKKAQRKAERLQRKHESAIRRPREEAENQVEPLPTLADDEVRQDEPGDGFAEATGDETGPHMPYDEPLLVEADVSDLQRVIAKCFKDLPPLDGRNWQSSFPPSLASMVMRRAKVDLAPRETYDAARRRLAADILPRLEGLPDHLADMSVEEAANPGMSQAWRLDAKPVVRVYDRKVVERATHPILVQLSDDADLLPALLFPGVERREQQGQTRTTVIRAWRHEDRLILEGFTHEGCLIGYRRVDIDVDTGEPTGFDSEADEIGSREVADQLFSCITDAVLGRVETADAWEHELAVEQRDKAQALRKHRTTSEDATATICADDASSATGCEELTHARPVDSSFGFWGNVSAASDRPILDMHALDRLDGLLGSNAVTRTMLQHFAERSRAGTLESDPVGRAVARHLATLSFSEEVRLDAVKNPKIPDEADLRLHAGKDGVVVVTDRVLFEEASPNLLLGVVPQRERPAVILYRIRLDGVSALVVQITPEGEFTLARWGRASLVETDNDDDFAWYLRGVIDSALTDQRGDVTQADIPPVALPVGKGVRRDGYDARQGPRRVIAQVRMKPESLRKAVEVITAWFDDQADRHGEKLIEDRRDAGEWTLEHVANDRGVTSRWAVTVRMPQDHPGCIDVIVRTTLATGVKPRLPTIVRDIAAATPTEGPDGPFRVIPRAITTKTSVIDLLRHLQSPDRVLPTLVMTPDRDGMYVKRPHEIARQALGAMNVVTLSHDMTFELSDLLGQEYRTFFGAVRLFQPRFDPDADPASRHPRIMMDAGAERQISDLISRATASTVTRYDISDVFRPVHQVADEGPAPVSDTAAAETEDRDQPTLPFDNIAAAGDGVSSTLDAVPNATAEATAPVDETTAPALAPAEPEPVAAREAETAGAVNTPRRSIRDGATDTKPVGNRQAFLPPPATPEPVRDVPTTPIHGDAPEAQVAPLDEERSVPPPATMLIDADAIGHMIEAAVGRRLEGIGIAAMLEQVAILTARLESASASISTIPAATPVAIAERDAEIAALKEELRAERESMAQLLDEAQANLNAAQAEVGTLRQALNERRREGIRGAAAQQWPTELSGLAEWLERNVLSNVEISNRAWRAMRKVRYTDMERLCRTLQLLDGAYIDMRAGEDGAKERWDEGLKTLRLENKKQSEMGKGVRSGKEYSFKHDGYDWSMDFHIRGAESLYNDTERLLRIYYAYDKEDRKVIIGHMPTHLTTVDS